MSQQINLLIREAVAPALSARRSLIGLGAIVAAFVLYAGYDHLGVVHLGNTVVQGDAQVAAEKARRQELEQKLAARPKLPDILAQIEVLKPQVAESEEILNLLRGGGSGGSEGYVAQFKAFAQISEDGVWLTGIKIANAGRTISLSGRSLRNESVLKYAQRLNERFAPLGVQFTSVELIPDVAKEGASGTALSSVAFKLF